MPEVIGLTVVTITYNDYVGLRNTANSLDDKCVQWIVVDGSNQDEIKQDNYNLLKSRKVLHIQEPDNGRFHAMNKGLIHATNNLVCFMNSGDQFYSQSTSKLIMESWEKNRWVWAVGSTIAVDEKNVDQWRWPMPKHNSLKLRLGINSYCHQATVYQTKILQEMGGFYEESLYSDWQTSLMLSNVHKPFISSDVWARFLTNGVSSQQTLNYWSAESIRLRKLAGVLITRLVLVDVLLQKSVEYFLKTRRGALIRPDLKRNYPI